MSNCSTTGVSNANGNWLDEELTTWNETTGQIQLKDLQENYPHADIKVLEVFNNIISEHFKNNWIFR
jgi:hypothetical protein